VSRTKARPTSEWGEFFGFFGDFPSWRAKTVRKILTPPRRVKENGVLF